MTDGAHVANDLRIRDLQQEDLQGVIRIDEMHVGDADPTYWREVLDGFLRPRRRLPGVGLAADGPHGLVGYLLGEVRAFEFGSEACGWIFGVGVDPACTRQRVASRLLAECCCRFRGMGVSRVRTMVERDNVPVLSLFRANGFLHGSFVQLELDLEDET